MAQKMAPTRGGNKKAGKKLSDRKTAHPAAGAKAPTKTKHKVVAAKAQTKHPAKPAPKAQHQSKVHQKPAALHPKPAAHGKVPPTAHKASVKEPMKAHLPKQHVAPKAAALSKPAARPAPAVPPPQAARSSAPISARSMPAAVAKTSGQKIIAPASPPAQPAAPQPPPAPPAPKKPVHQRHGFKINEWIVYPAHGVGRIVAIDEQEIAGIALELFVITFEKDKMTLRVPTGKSESVGMRKLAEEPTVKKAIETLKGRARIKRTMWSRRAQEYEAKINSGDLIAIAEVVRDLYRSESQPEQSYSERQLYEAALDRMAREIAVVEKLDERGAVQRITDVLAKSARGRRLAAEEAEEKAA
ncbi:MAG TPA: CarD family transcriptional regulator [Hyphomicrobiaceae bacterium]|jgi:CarD family transcriptional regulator|nr:CarD family transcriptional regulator [Hyphomicrobiaceae bacterium]